MPKVSIITPCYNAEQFIQRTIISVGNQTLTDWEHIIVDDGSQDNSAGVVRGILDDDPRLRLVQQANGGVASARNHGYRASSPNSDYLLFLDADDYLEPTMLQVLTAHLDLHPDVGMAYCGHIFVDEDDRVLDAARIPWTARQVPRGLGVGCLSAEHIETPFVSLFTLAGLVPSIAVLRRAVYAQTPGWDESLGHIYEDTDLFLQMALRSRVHYLTQPLVRYRRHGSQSTSDASRVANQETKLYAKWRHIEGLTAEQRAVVDAAVRFREGRLLPHIGRRLAIECLRRGEVRHALFFLAGAVRRYLASLIHRNPQRSH